MGKTRVHLLAKELGVETKDLIAQLDKLGMRGRKAQSAMEDDEVARVRAALALQEKPQVHVGEEKVVADRVVKTEDETHSALEARETVVERRVRTNVIRRRTSRIEMPHAEKPDENIEAVKESAENEPLAAAETAVASHPPIEDLPGEMPDDTAEIYDEPVPAHDEPAEEIAATPGRCCADRRIYRSGRPSAVGAGNS